MSFLSKILLFTGLLAVVSIICVWIAGGETTKHSTSITIDANKEQVFRYLVEGEKIKLWAKDVIDVGSYSEEGASTSERRALNASGVETIYAERMMRFDPPESFSFMLSNNGMSQTYVFLLRENEVRGTNLEYRSTRSATGVGRMLFPFAKDATDARMVSEMRKLKSIVESEVEPATGDFESSDEEPEESSTEEAATVDAEKVETKTVAVDPVPASPEIVTVESKPEKVAEPSQPLLNSGKPELSERKFESLFGTGG